MNKDLRFEKYRQTSQISNPCSMFDIQKLPRVRYFQSRLGNFSETYLTF